MALLAGLAVPVGQALLPDPAPPSTEERPPTAPDPTPTAAEPQPTPQVTATAAPRADSEPVTGIWLGPEELAALPMSGDAWVRLVGTAESRIGKANLADQDSRHGVDTLAVSLVAARTGDDELRDKAVENLLAVIGTDDNRDSDCETRPKIARSLAVSRNLAGYIIAADIIGLRPDGDPSSPGSRFGAWVDMVRRKQNCPNTSETDGEGRTLSEAHDSSGSNGSALAGAARIAAALYLGDDAEVEAAWATYRRFAGDRSVGPDLTFNENGLTWSHDPSAPVAVNPAGTTKDGHRIDGAIVNDQGRGGSFEWPPGYTQYPWEGLQGFVLQAELLARAGYPAWEVSDSAPLRAMDYQYFLSETFDDPDWWQRSAWVKHVVNRAYGTDYPVAEPASGGRNMAWTDWTHASSDRR